jgi:hypothetical protein
MISRDFHDETVTLTPEELTVISDIFRRLEPGSQIPVLSYFTGKAEFHTAMEKLEHAKWKSFREVKE